MKINFPYDIYEGDNHIVFLKPFLVLDWYDISKDLETAYVAFDFGMKTEVYMPFVEDYLKLNISVEEKIIKKISFDLFHAFFHTPEDPNYTYYHWALYGNLRKRVNLAEDEFDGHDECEDEKPI